MFIKVSNFDVGIRHRLPSVFPTSLHKQLVIYVLRHGGCHALQSKISPSLIGERTHITLAVRRQGYHTLVCILDTDIRNFECGKWFKTPDGFRNITLRLVAHFLPDDLSFVGHTEQHRATFAVKESVSMPRSNCPVVSLNSTCPFSFSAISCFTISRLSMFIFNS